MIWGWLTLLQPETGLDAHASLCTAIWTPCYPVYTLLSMRGSRIFRQGGSRSIWQKKPWQRFFFKSSAYVTEVKWLISKKTPWPPLDPHLLSRPAGDSFFSVKSSLGGIFMPPKELWEAYSNRTVHQSVRPSRFVSGAYLLYSLR